MFCRNKPVDLVALLQHLVEIVLADKFRRLVKSQLVDRGPETSATAIRIWLHR